MDHRSSMSPLPTPLPLPVPSTMPLPLSMPLLLSMPLPWSMLLLWSMPPSTLPPCTAELDKCPTSLCPSLTRASTGPPPSPRPSEPPSQLSTTLPAPSTELTAGRDLLLLDTELSLVKKIHQLHHFDDHHRQLKTSPTF